MLVRYRSVIEKVRCLRDTLRRQVTRFLLDHEPAASSDNRDQVVFVRWDGKLGDTIVLSWVYREIANRRPDLKVTVITHAALAGMHRDDFGVQDVMVSSKRPGLFEIFRLTRRIRHVRYVVHLTENFRPRDFWFVRCVAPAVVVGLDDSVRSVNYKLGQKTQDLHFSQKLVPWFQSIGIRDPDTRYQIASHGEARQRVLSSWPGGKVIGFCPFGAGVSRRLSEAKITALIEIMVRESDHAILLISDPQTRPVALRFVNGPNQARVFLLPDGGDLGVLFESIRLCDCVVTVDTAIVHIASGLNKPQLALYNPDVEPPSNFAKWHPNSANAIPLFAERTTPQNIDALDDGKFEESFLRLVTLS